MKLAFYLAKKFLFGKHRGLLGASLTWIAVAGVFVSVFAFTIVYSGAIGLSQDLVKKILGFSAHLTLQNPEILSSIDQKKIESDPEVLRTFSYLEGEAILRSREAPPQGVQIRGIDGATGLSAETLKIYLEEGESLASLRDAGSKMPGIILGSELASDLGVSPALGEKIELLFPLGEVGPSGDLEPSLRAFRLIGIFKSGYYDFDSKYVLIDRQQAQYLLGDLARNKMGIFLNDAFAAQNFKQKKLSSYPIEVTTWMEQHQKLFKALKLDRFGINFILALMLLLATFNIFSLTMMLVYEHRREIAILKALGLSASGISKIFYQAGLFVGVVGAFLGAFLGALTAYGLKNSSIVLPSPYYLDVLPFKIEFLPLLLVMLVSIILAIAATAFPAREASRFEVLEILRRD